MEFRLFRGILLAGLITGVSCSFGVTNEAAVLRDMRLDVKHLKLKVGYPGKFLEVPENDNPQYFEQTTEMIEVRPGVWRTPLPLALRILKSDTVE